jgi:hypothetical protein
VNVAANPSKRMDFRKRVERALDPMVAELREELGQYPTFWVLNHYLLKTHFARIDKSEMPDGYWVKWRYLWAVLLSLPWQEVNTPDAKEPDWDKIDKLIEQIFDVYRFGAIYDPGVTPGSEPEFLARLGLAIKVREPDVLAFPEQIKDWALTRFEPFGDTFFRPSFGVYFMEIIAWVDSLIKVVETRAGEAVNEGLVIRRDVERLRDRFVENPFDLKSIRAEGTSIQLEERMTSNGERFQALYVFTAEELRKGIPSLSQVLIDLLAIAPGQISVGFRYPHEENPIEFKTFLALPNGPFVFLDPGNAYRIIAKIAERQIMAKDSLRDRYLKKRDKLTEAFVAGKIQAIFTQDKIYSNYYLEKGSHEKDILVAYGETLVLFECKNFRVRTFAGGGDDLVKYENDFEKSVQYAYDQALEVKQRILANDRTIFYDEKGREWFTIERSRVKRIFIVCVTITPRGLFGTDLSYQLEKPESEPYPVSINLFDFETIAQHLNTPEQFLSYLAAREPLHGKVRTGDELNFAGYYLKYGHLNIQDQVYLDDSFAAIFDRRWYAEKGFHLDEPTNAPILTSVVRSGDKVTIDGPTGKKVITVPPPMMELIGKAQGVVMTGSDRNKPCVCGSGKKAKKCCGRI